jgi:2-keto-4-pentenoate hydratase/2-oxohepta-3-ene-1,7-dioic acid hydratase in catechol pathway
MSLRPGDVIITGTPAGIGMATQDYQKVGDAVMASGDGLGKQSRVIRG